jgi:hypothetical protein
MPGFPLRRRPGKGLRDDLRDQQSEGLLASRFEEHNQRSIRSPFRLISARELENGKSLSGGSRSRASSSAPIGRHLSPDSRPTGPTVTIGVRQLRHQLANPVRHPGFGPSRTKTSGAAEERALLMSPRPNAAAASERPESLHDQPLLASRHSSPMPERVREQLGRAGRSRNAPSPRSIAASPAQRLR